jgi:hypothetical protein
MSQAKILASLRSRWHGMIGRCTRKNHPAYPLYGARGIQVCDEWFDFDTFVTWSLNNGFKMELTLERKDNDGNYTPSNCIWADHPTQMQNTRRTGSYVELDQLTRFI